MVNVEDETEIVRRAAIRAIKRCPPTVQLEDLIGAGNIGLMEAAHSFDETRGVAFGAFATTRVRGAILDYMRASRRTAAQGLDGVDVGRQDEGLRIVDLRDEVEAALSRLDPRTASLLRMFFIGGLSLKSAAERLGFTESNASRILSATLPGGVRAHSTSHHWGHG